jgi:hypothetical protein
MRNCEIIKETSSLYSGLAVFCLFEARVPDTEYTEWWPCPLFDILLNKSYPAGLAWWQVGHPSVLLVQISWKCTPPYLSTGISNLLQPAQAEVVLGQISWYLASWVPEFNTLPRCRLYCTLNSASLSGTPALNCQNTSSPKYIDDISMTIYE